MEFKICAVFSFVLFVSLVQNAASMPKDSIVKAEKLPPHSITEVEMMKQLVNPIGSPIPGRVWCQHTGTEPAEDVTCQRHCIPKGYSFGLCVSNMCSCI